MVKVKRGYIYMVHLVNGKRKYVKADSIEHAEELDREQKRHNERHNEKAIMASELKRIGKMTRSEKDSYMEEIMQGFDDYFDQLIDEASHV